MLNDHYEKLLSLRRDRNQSWRVEVNKMYRNPVVNDLRFMKFVKTSNVENNNGGKGRTLKMCAESSCKDSAGFDGFDLYDVSTSYWWECMLEWKHC
ncbi:15698_t:CDS:2 [Gigaspora rosea]|nr:15698_t:CDS:2 [Gigaspora rosea]